MMDDDEFTPGQGVLALLWFAAAAVIGFVVIVVLAA